MAGPTAPSPPLFFTVWDGNSTLSTPPCSKYLLPLCFWGTTTLLLVERPGGCWGFFFCVFWDALGDLFFHVSVNPPWDFSSYSFLIRRSFFSRPPGAEVCSLSCPLRNEEAFSPPGKRLCFLFLYTRSFLRLSIKVRRYLFEIFISFPLFSCPWVFSDLPFRTWDRLLPLFDRVPDPLVEGFKENPYFFRRSSNLSSAPFLSLFKAPGVRPSYALSLSVALSGLAGISFECPGFPLSVSPYAFS